MLLRVLAIFYFALYATFLVAQPTQDENTYHEGLIRRQNLSLGIEMFSQANFLGLRTTKTDASMNDPIDLGGSYQVVGDARAVITSFLDNATVIIWDSAPDTATLPLPPPPIGITNIQSSGCSPPCTGAGTCSLFLPICVCSEGYNGTLCQFCAEGHFGPTCQPCPSNCTSCDQGMSGSGRCLVPKAHTAAECECLNGVCDANGQCNCLPGWGKAVNGTKCAQCEPGFFLSKSGGCQICQLGCVECEDVTGNCITCQSNFTQDLTDKTKCRFVPSKSSEGVVCPTGSFNGGNSNLNSTGCPPCSKICRTCTGPTSNDCIVCNGLQALFNNSCVALNADGICDGTGGMIADNNKHKCEGCGAVEANCVSCKIPNFSVASTINEAQCTGCLAGFFISKGKCVKTCPSGTFASGNACTECSSSCATCAGTADSCLTCTNGFASSGKCVTTCPHGTFASKNACIKCHPDCKTCKGASFDECSSCSPHLPVLQSGRCLATCGHTQFFNPTTSTCQKCDASCSSCAASGPNKCLACKDSALVVVNGTCTPVPQLVSF